MQLTFKRVTSNGQAEMKDVLLLANARMQADFKHGPEHEMVGVVFRPGMFYILAYEEGKPVGFVECRRRRTLSGGRFLELYELVTHPARRREGIAQRLVRFVNTQAAQRGYARVVIPRATKRVLNMVQKMREAPPQRIRPGQKPQRLESTTIQDSRVVFRLRRRTVRR